MARMLFTDLSLRALQGSDQYVTYFDTKTPGFGVRVGKRSKTFLVVRGKNRERVTIGRFPDLPLSEARTKAKKLLAAPSEPKASRIPFTEARDEYLGTFPKSDHRYHLTLIFKRHFKSLEGKQIAKIDDSDIRAALDAIEGPSARLHAFRAIRAFFRWALRPPHRYLTHSPLEGYEAPGSDKKGTRILSDDELKAVWNASGEGTRRVFRLLILWGTRSGETCALRQDWIADGVLTIPGSHTKNGRDHSIPLLPLASELLESLPVLDGQFFPGKTGHIQSHSLVKIMKQLQEDEGLSGFTIRDIRRTFRSNMARLKVPRDVCEVLINHAPPVLDEIYDRYDRIEEKREALQKYERFMIELLRRG